MNVLAAEQCSHSQSAHQVCARRSMSRQHLRHECDHLPDRWTCSAAAVVCVLGFKSFQTSVGQACLHAGGQARAQLHGQVLSRSWSSLVQACLSARLTRWRPPLQLALLQEAVKWPSHMPACRWTGRNRTLVLDASRRPHFAQYASVPGRQTWLPLLEKLRHMGH